MELDQAAEQLRLTPHVRAHIEAELRRGLRAMHQAGMAHGDVGGRERAMELGWGMCVCVERGGPSSWILLGQSEHCSTACSTLTSPNRTSPLLVHSANRHSCRQVSRSNDTQHNQIHTNLLLTYLITGCND